MRTTSAERNQSDDTSPARERYRFTMYCRRCDELQPILKSNVASAHRTSEGVVGYIRCAVGHMVIHEFSSNHRNAKPPASVIQLQARLPVVDATSEYDALAQRPIVKS